VLKVICAEISHFFGSSNREFSHLRRKLNVPWCAESIVSHHQAILELRLLLGSQRPSSRYAASFLSAFATELLAFHLGILKADRQTEPGVLSSFSRNIT